MFENRSFRLFVTLVLLVAVFVVSAAYYAAAPTALAADGHAPENGCQVGANNENIGEWQLFSREDFVEFLMSRGMDEEDAVKRTDAIWAFCDHNNDGYTCVLDAHLPNGDNWKLIEDNHPFGGQ